MKLKVYFDGACQLCSREIEHYAKKDQKKEIQFIDISSPLFSAEAEGLDPIKVNQEIHIRDESGKDFTGVEGFILLWSVLPGYGFLSKFAAHSWIKPGLKIAYFIFARSRPYLPKRKANLCETGTCYLNRN